MSEGVAEYDREFEQATIKAATHFHPRDLQDRERNAVGRRKAATSVKSQKKEDN